MDIHLPPFRIIFTHKRDDFLIATVAGLCFSNKLICKVNYLADLHIAKSLFETGQNTPKYCDLYQFIQFMSYSSCSKPYPQSYTKPHLIKCQLENESIRKTDKKATLGMISV